MAALYGLFQALRCIHLPNKKTHSTEIQKINQKKCQLFLQHPSVTLNDIMKSGIILALEMKISQFVLGSAAVFSLRKTSFLEDDLFQLRL